MQYFRSIFFHLYLLKKVKIGILKLSHLDMVVDIEDAAAVVLGGDEVEEIEGEDVVEIKTTIGYSVILVFYFQLP